MFKQITCDIENSYHLLENSTNFEDITIGRKGAILVKPNSRRHVPIVRTTTAYQQPASNMTKIHQQIVDNVTKNLGLNLKFNNAMIEIYDDNYKTMGYHSDQALDLADSIPYSNFFLLRYTKCEQQNLANSKQNHQN